jgi:hypothetical protein
MDVKSKSGVVEEKKNGLRSMSSPLNSLMPPETGSSGPSALLLLLHIPVSFVLRQLLFDNLHAEPTTSCCIAVSQLFAGRRQGTVLNTPQLVELNSTQLSSEQLQSSIQAVALHRY